MRFVTSGLRVRYPAQSHWALGGIDLAIESGEVTWLTGALGSGTSTLLLALAGLAPRLSGGTREGSVLTDDCDPANESPLAAGIAYLGPSPALQISGVASTVHHEIALGPMNLGRPRAEIEDATVRAMESLGVDALADRAPGALSGGETQRVALAALLAAAPRAWLLDEPFSALDRAGTLRLQELLREWARAGASVVVACDDADTALAVADRVIVLRAGMVAIDGSPRSLLRGDLMREAGAGGTDASELATDAGIHPPRPITPAELLERLPPLQGTPHRDSEIEVASTTSTASARLSFSNVAFAYPGGTPVLAGVTLNLGAGDGLGLFGANGAGKSTLLRLAMALEHPDRGIVEVFGRGTAGLHPEDLAPRAGYLFQQPEQQLFAASVEAECSLAPRLAGWDPDRIAAVVAETLVELGLADTADEHPYDLPLPRRRLVALAAVIAADPELLLLDEPTAGLDFASRERVIRVVRQRVARGRTVVAITHDAIFAHEALGRGIVLEGGRVVLDGPVRDVLDDHRLLRPVALSAALVLGLPPGHDRRADVARMLRDN